ncbi:MAG: ATP-grasp domain-containing protein [Lewinellaceae bacterium]|nr:ATP-grasp domain-containing protein [Lewinellaceae bacterium]
MILIDGPYVSDFLKKTLREKQIPVIETPIARKLLGDNYFYVPEQEAVEKYRQDKALRLFTNSENSIAWVEQHLSFLDIPEKVKIFKNKVKFRELLKPMFPGYFFKSVAFTQLDEVEVNSLPVPFVIKPAVGFFSMGVHNVETREEWPGILATIKEEMDEVRDLYPIEVMDATTFIFEQHIKGEEYAVDCYFSASGEPVILNIMHHVFSSGKDVSDRVYITSREIIQTYKKPLEAFLAQLGQLAGLTNFLIHIEVRIDESGHIAPIEVNPMRFGGWCTTADLTWYAYGFNSYEYFHANKRPDWEQILGAMDDALFSLIVLDNNTGIKGRDIKSFDYERLAASFQKPLTVRKVNHREFPLFGFVFTQTPKSHTEELDRILISNLREFVIE